MNNKDKDLEGQTRLSATHQRDQEKGSPKKNWIDPKLHEMILVNTTTGIGADGGLFATS